MTNLRLGIEEKTLENLCSDGNIKTYFLEIINSIGIEENIPSWEIPRAIFLESEPFSVINGLLTPSEKMKRLNIKNKYQEQFDLMYGEVKKTQYSLSVTDILNETLGIQSEENDVPLRDLGLDSVSAIQICSRVFVFYFS